MRKFSVIIMSMVFSAGALAETKIAVIDMAELLQKAPQMQEIRERLSEEFKDEETALEAKQQELRALQEKAAKELEKMSETERTKLQEQFLKLRGEFNQMLQTYQQERGQRQEEELGQFERLVTREVQAYARDNGYDVVLSAGVLYKSPSVNITDEVLDRLISAKPVEQ